MRPLLLLPALALALLAPDARSAKEPPPPPRWPCLGGNARHTGLAPVPAQALETIRWSAPVDLQPPYDEDGHLLIHYGTPLVTAGNTVVFPVKTGASGGFRVEARRGDTGALVWQLDTDYVLPAHGWVPSMGPCLLPDDGVAIPAAGGTVLLRSAADEAGGSAVRVAFYGTEDYEEDPAAYDGVRINTPITCDAKGNLYFGFTADAAAPGPLKSGFARVSRTGRGRWVAAEDAAGDPGMVKVAHNCAPALDRKERTIYGVCTDAHGTGFGSGVLVRLDARTLARRRAAVLDEGSIPEDASSSPTVAPDGRVFFGVFTFANHFRGRMLQFDSSLAERHLAGGFGWDDTPSIVPVEAVPSYAGRAKYLLLTKYNDYVQGGGDGAHRLAVLDPRASMTDPIDGSRVMEEVLTVVGPTPDDEFVEQGHPDAVREWCINTAAVDVAGRCALVNNEDGILYRWDFVTNTLAESIVLTEGIGEAYTPTVVGPDGTVYAINDATLFAVGAQ